jgi:hypothetical protein
MPAGSKGFFQLVFPKQYIKGYNSTAIKGREKITDLKSLKYYAVFYLYFLQFKKVAFNQLIWT